MKVTIIHSAIGVAAALVVGLAVSGNVVGQTATPPSGLPPVSPAPSLTPLPPPPTPALTPLPPTPAAPVPVPPRIDPSMAPGGPTPAIIPKPGAPNPPVALPRANFAPAPVPVPGFPGGGGAPATDPTDQSHGHEDSAIGGPAPGGGKPMPPEPIKGEYITREWKVSPELINDGHGGSTNPIDFLQRIGVRFGGRATATFNPETSTLVVKNTPEQIKLIEGVLAPPPPRPVAGASGLPGMPGTTGAGDHGEVLTPAESRKPSVARVHGVANYLPSPERETAPVAGYVGGSTAVNEPVNTISVLKAFPVASIDVGRANLAAELNQDPQASASRYAAIVANFDAQRQAAATAVYGLGEAYRKMGRNAEARIQYARILREFVDFPELARQSQRQLSTTSGTLDPEFVGTAGGGNAETSDEELVLVKEELSLLERELATTQDRIQAGISPQSEGLQLQRDILRLKQQLVRLSRGAGRAPSTTPPSADGGGSHEPTPARQR